MSFQVLTVYPVPRKWKETGFLRIALPLSLTLSSVPVWDTGSDRYTGRSGVSRTGTVSSVGDLSGTLATVSRIKLRTSELSGVIFEICSTLSTSNSTRSSSGSATSESQALGRLSLTILSSRRRSSRSSPYSIAEPDATLFLDSALSRTASTLSLSSDIKLMSEKTAFLPRFFFQR